MSDTHEAASTSAEASSSRDSTALVGVIMGSRSDWETMQHAVEMLNTLEVPHEVRVVSAHRTPDLLFQYAQEAEARGLRVIIAGAGGAAHLPGMVAAKTHLPVLGVPVTSRTLNGLDSLLSIVQMPAGVPVATLAIGRAGATNAALLAASILAPWHSEIREALLAFRRQRTEAVLADPDPRQPVPGSTAHAHIQAQRTTGAAASVQSPESLKPADENPEGPEATCPPEEALAAARAHPSEAHVPAAASAESTSEAGPRKIGEQAYGEQSSDDNSDVLYLVERFDTGWIKVSARHRDGEVNRTLRNRAHTPSYFLGQCEPYFASHNPAKVELAKLVRDHESHFREGKVVIEANPADG